MPVKEGDHVLGTRAVSSKWVKAIIEVSWPTVRALAIEAATPGRPRSTRRCAYLGLPSD
jgi:hypothetical protein